MSSSTNAQALQVALSHLAGALTYTEPTNIGTTDRQRSKTKRRRSSEMTMTTMRNRG